MGVALVIVVLLEAKKHNIQLTQKKQQPKKDGMLLKMLSGDS